MSLRRLGIVMLGAGVLSVLLLVLLRLGEAPASAAGRAATAPVAAAPETAPDLSGFVDAAGAPLAPAALSGRTAVLNLLATWCAPCLAELPALNRLAAAGRADDGWAVVGLVADLRTPEDLAVFAAKHGIEFPLYVLPQGGLERRMRVVGYPTTLLLAADGRVLRRVMGPEEWDSAAWQRRLRELRGAGGNALP